MIASTNLVKFKQLHSNETLNEQYENYAMTLKDLGVLVMEMTLVGTNYNKQLVDGEIQDKQETKQT